MRLIVFAALMGLAIFIWVSIQSSAEHGSIKERFQDPPSPPVPPISPGMSGSDKNKQIVSDVMDMYKELYGQFPATEILVHYRDLAATLTREELKARIKMDGGAPPGMKLPSASAEADIAAIKPPVPGALTQPILPPKTAPPAGSRQSDPVLATKLAALAAQLGAIADELKAGGTSAPAAFETFMPF